MRKLQDILDEFDAATDTYEALELKFVSDQSELHRRFSICYKHLADHRIEAHARWMSHKYHSTKQSNAAKESEADMKTPELYKIRHVMSACKILVEATRMTISVSKKQ